jgi:hypothetical protein
VLTLFSGRHFMHVRRALALTLAVPVLLAGCSDDEPAPTPKIPEPTSSSPTPTEAATEEPEAESPEEFIRRWQAAGDEMQRTGDTSAYLRISPKCQACRSLAESVDDIYADGGRIEFAGAEVVRIRSAGAKPPTYDVGLRLPETVIYRSAAGDSETLPPGSMTIRVTLKEARGNWTVTHYGVL